MKTALTLFSALLLAPFAALHAAEGKPARPNVLIFLTDDESWLERSAFGWSKIPTPNFDHVAKQGVLFTHGYTSAPSCAPSRAALLTGRNFWELEQGAFIQAWLPSKFAVLPDLMQAAGYHAGYTGKGYSPALMKPSGRTQNPAGIDWNKVVLKRGEEEKGFSRHDYVANFKGFLEAKPADQPFFFWAGISEPHAPWDPSNADKLKAKYGIGMEDIKVPDFLPDTPGMRRTRANMLYEVCRLDEFLGRMLKMLELRGELDNTLIILSADNGTGLARAKANIYDWGLRVPLAMMWPARVKGGRVVDDFVNFADIAPTILEAAGLPVPSAMSGRSALNVLLSDKDGRVDPARSFTVGGLEWHGELSPHNWSGRMIRDERYQFIVNYSSSPRQALKASSRLPDSEYENSIQTASENELVAKHPDHPKVKPFVKLLYGARPAEELYDCQVDPFELNNLADSPEHAATKARLKAHLETYQRQTKDPRITGDMALFEKTRAFVEDRKRKGYEDKDEVEILKQQ